MKLYMGKYYKINSKIPGENPVVFRAKLCIFCNGKNVTNYHRCLFSGLGMSKVIKGRFPELGCIPSDDVEEISEDEFIVYSVVEEL